MSSVLTWEDLSLDAPELNQVTITVFRYRYSA